MKEKTYSVADIQKKLLVIIQWFHEFCAEHHLRYYAIGGTLLGAVRHKGFIPWDDDADFAMPRADYNKFLQLSKDNSPRFVTETIFDGNKDFAYRHCKVYDTSTTVVYKKKYKMTRGLFIDIFPLDGIGNTKEEAQKNYKKFKRRDHFIAAKTTYHLDKKLGLIKNLGGVIMRILPYSWRKTIKKIHRFCERIDYDSSEYVSNCFGAWGIKEIWKKEWMGEPTLYEFDGIKIYGPQDAHSCLVQEYGDYMTPPPPEKRVSEHSYLYMDLETPYRIDDAVSES